MPNILAYVMLAIWPIVALVLFLRLSPAQAVVATLLGGYLLLPPPPAVFDFAMMPPLSKETIPSLAAFALAVTMLRPRLHLWPENRAGRALLALFVLSPLATWATNTEPVLFAQGGLPGMRLSEAFALMVAQAMLAMPFLLGRALLADHAGRRVLLMGFLIGGLVYSIPMLIEVRLSPQMNVWVYGYFQHYFAQMVRAGGFRPIVFLYHGLWAAFFIMSAMVAAFALSRDDGARTRNGAANAKLLIGGYLAAVLILCKSLGSALFGALAAPLVLLAPGRWQVGLAALAAVGVLAYPVLKQADLVPVETMVAQAAKLSEQRANSLQFRFDNETALFERASAKPLFGWGNWGRNHLHDQVSGAITTVTDGRWIITLGVYGWVGFLAEFGLLTLPLFALWREARRPGAELPALIAPLALLHALNMIDLVPNATLTPLSWLFAGALLGCAERMRRAYRRPVVEPVRTVL